MVLVYSLNVSNSHDRSVVLISGVCFTESLILVDVKEHMAVVYATLIVKGKKTIDQVPSLIRKQVEEILADLEVTV